MKKLMITAGAVAIAAGAFATAPTVYDYKASVKHMYLKEVVVRDTSLANPQNVHVYQKIQKTSSLKGYLIQDTQACLGGKVTTQTPTDTRAWDQRRNRAFLVVLNSSATPATIRQPKIMPAVLEAKFMDKSLNGRNYLTEGTLYVGGDLVVLSGVNAANTNLRPYLMPGAVPAGIYGAVTLGAPWTQSIENATTPRPRQNAKGYFGDYLWTSAYLFGQFNGPQWSTANWGVAENKVITGMPQFMKPRNTALNVAEVVVNPVAGVNGYYHDTWMNHAGFGTGIAGSTDTAVCCGLSTVTSVPVTLQSLSGNMKGGLFICSENGFYTGAEAVAPYGVYRRGDLWEDQFWSAAINRAKATATAGDVYPVATYYGATAINAGDVYQNDIWTDGDVETFTTDVMSGTWSIKLNTRLAGVALTRDEVVGTFKNGPIAAATPQLNTTAATTPGFVPTAPNSLTNAQQDIWDLNEMLKGAATALSRSVIFANGTEISSKVGNANRFQNLPMITPKFAAVYGLDGQHLWNAAPVNFNPAAANSIYR